MNSISANVYSEWYFFQSKQIYSEPLCGFFDPDTDEPHIYVHGVEEDEVEDILSFPGEDRRGRGQSRTAIGRTRRGRYLRVIYIPHLNPEEVFVITAYELRGRQLAAYRRRMRRRGK